jgi:hypothetical protein
MCDTVKETAPVCEFCRHKLKKKVCTHMPNDLASIICDYAYDTMDYTDMKYPVKKMNKWQQSFMKKYS